MARIRFIKPDYFKDEDIAALPYEVRLLYIGLWTLADKEGRLEDRPKRIKVELFPYDNIDVEKCLEILSKRKTTSNKPFINRYAVKDLRYIEILSWNKHQNTHKTEKESLIPPSNGILNIESGILNIDICGQSQVVVKEPLNNGCVTVKEPKENRDVFKKPTVEEIKTYAEQIKVVVNPNRFFDFYESKGWMVGKNKMKCWKSAVRNWGNPKDKDKPAGDANEPEKLKRVMERVAEANRLESEMDELLSKGRK